MLIHKLRFTLVLGLGFLLGGLAILFVLYDKTGRRVVQRVREIVGLSEYNAARYSYGHEAVRVDSWRAVRSPTHPEWNVRPGFDVKLVAEGLDYPVNLVFVPNRRPEPDSPVFYVNELHGKIKYVGRDGVVRTYAEGLTNFKPVTQDKSDETGLSGLMMVPGTEDLLVTGAFQDESSGLLQNRILRLRMHRAASESRRSKPYVCSTNSLRLRIRSSRH